jgi:hypothetical protein
MSISTTGVKLKEKVYLNTVNIWDQLQRLIEVDAIMQHMLEFSSVPGILCVTGLNYAFKMRVLPVTFSNILSTPRCCYVDI